MEYIAYPNEMLIVLCLLTTNAMSFLLGKFQERWEWNKLIVAGKIPKPMGGHREG